MIEIFDYNLDSANLEIFPKEIWQDPYVVFHGTSVFHSDNIESNGLIKGLSPFDINDGNELIRVLNLPQVKPFDKATIFDLTTAKTLKSYIIANQQNDFRLSFSYLSYQCVLFSTGKAKGGQTFGNIRDAKMIIEEAIRLHPGIVNEITQPITRLYQLAQDIESAPGVVYAIKLTKPLTGITEEYGVIHSTKSISKEAIIAKVIIPAEITPASFDKEKIKKTNKSKLLKLGHLGVLLSKRHTE